MAVESPQVAIRNGGAAAALVMAEDLAMATFEAGTVAVEFCGMRMRLMDEERMVEEDMVVLGAG